MLTLCKTVKGESAENFFLPIIKREAMLITIEQAHSAQFYTLLQKYTKDLNTAIFSYNKYLFYYIKYVSADNTLNVLNQ